jgi:hypothetical protein
MSKSQLEFGGVLSYVWKLVRESEDHFGAFGFIALIITAIVKGVSWLLPSLSHPVFVWIFKYVPGITTLIAFLCLFVASYSLYGRALKEWPKSQPKIEFYEPKISINKLAHMGN